MKRVFRAAAAEEGHHLPLGDQADEVFERQAALGLPASENVGVPGEKGEKDLLAQVLHLLADVASAAEPRPPGQQGAGHARLDDRRQPGNQSGQGGLIAGHGSLHQAGAILVVHVCFDDQEGRFTS